MKKQILNIPHHKYSKMTLDQRRSFFLKRHSDYLLLERKLFRHGGSRLIYEPNMDSRNCSNLLSRGKHIKKTFEVIGDVGTVSECHSDSLIYWLVNDDVKIHTGYSLSEDGKWRHHSWIERPGQFYETTPQSRIAYFGYAMNDREATKLFHQVFTDPLAKETLKEKMNRLKSPLLKGQASNGSGLCWVVVNPPKPNDVPVLMENKNR